MSDFDAEQALLATSRLPYGAARSAAAASVATRIEAEGPAEKLPEALLDLVEAYTFNGEAPKAFPAFARLLRLWDASPELFDRYDARNLFWEFKWIASDVPDFPQISTEQARAFLDDMRRRYALAGHGMAAVALAEFAWAWHSGSPGVDEVRKQWLATPADELQDCGACRTGQLTDHLVELGRFAEAVEVGEQIDGSCNLEPTRTFHALALAYLNQGRPAEAVAALRQGQAAFDPSTSDFAPSRGQGFELLARGGQIERALIELREDYQSLLLAASSPLFRLRFLIGVLAGLSANLDAADLPTGLREVPAATVGELHAWVLGEATGLADSFDARHGNSYYRDLVDRASRATRVAEPVELARLAQPVDQPSGPAQDHIAGAPEPDQETLWQRAERMNAAGDQARAAAAYAQAAHEAEEAGRLGDSGLAWAESARCAELLDDLEQANQQYERGVQRLLAGGESELAVAVIEAWAPVASRLGRTAALVALLASVEAAIESPAPAERLGDLAVAHHREVTVLRAILLDTRARTIGATAPSDRTEGAGIEDAVRAATQAGELFANAGRPWDSAHAFWLAGRLQVEARASQDAILSLESAMEGFTAFGDRTARAETAGELIAVLEATGQQERAQQVTESLLD